MSRQQLISVKISQNNFGTILALKKQNLRLLQEI